MNLKITLGIILFLMMSACAPTRVASTNELRSGMTYSEVEDALGNPSQSEFIADKHVWKYKLHEPWVGFIPYYLVFDKDSQRLQEWYANEAEYYRQQELWLRAFPPTQKHEVEVTID